ncbi:zinc transporter ZIP13-like [Halichondria panicea]|uniref:zinc transporter ZIP13-like n=1 Tax=Halichondria panicea TaxID=6063 RepID=UPI00312B686D
MNIIKSTCVEVNKSFCCYVRTCILHGKCKVQYILNNKMGCVLLLLCLLLCAASLAEAHIHSQKVHVDRDRLTMSTWLYALLSSALVGACGVFPVFLNRWIQLDSSCKDSVGFRAILCFAVGGLLGDVFLHLLPEAWSDPSNQYIGLWVMAGLLTFLIVEKVVKHTEMTNKQTELVETDNLVLNSNCSNSVNTTHNGTSLKQNNSFKDSPPKHKNITKISQVFDKDISGYLNLVANCTDNFTHGLAIAASYVASPMVGLLTTVAILCHEIPHEIGDFAILINSGFSLKEAAKAQMLTATGGLFGVVAGLTAEYLSSVSSWLLPFTAGGFLYIALVSITPEIIEVKTFKHLILDALSLGVGVVVMAMVTIVEKTSCDYVPSHYL